MINLRPYYPFKKGLDAIAADPNSSFQDGIGNTRQFLNTHLDYLRLRLTIPSLELQEFLQYVTYDSLIINSDRNYSSGPGAPIYDISFYGKRGIRGGYSPQGTTTSIMIEFPGSFWENLNIIESKDFCKHIYNKYGCIASRIDIAIDDFTFDIIPVDEIYQAFINGNGFYFRNFKKIQSGDIDFMDTTYYYGSRNSGKMVRIYTHKFSDNSKALRWETEFKRNHADIVFKFFISSLYEHDEFQSIQKDLSSLAVSVIDFRDKSNLSENANTSALHTQRLPFYERFIKSLGEFIRIKLPPILPPSLQKTLNWLKKQVSSSLAALYFVLPVTEFESIFHDIISVGSRSDTIRTKIIIEELREYTEKLNFA